MSRLVISLLLASAAALDEQRLRGARSSDLERRGGGRHTSFGSITPRYDDAPLITCEGNEGKCIGPEGVIEEGVRTARRSGAPETQATTRAGFIHSGSSPATKKT